jgi:hypothetical protein
MSLDTGTAESHPTQTLLDVLKERYGRLYADYYAEELVFAAEANVSVIAAQALVKACQARIASARAVGNQAELISFTAALPRIVDMDIRADRMLYGDGAGNYE